MATYPEWGPVERSARIETGVIKERIIEQFLDSKQKRGPTFSLYYFVKDLTYGATEEEKKKKTILFAAGGPGQIVRVQAKNFVDIPGYRAVYFHLRGTGFSQIPKSSEFDRFLRTSYAAADIEEIRKDLLGNDQQWYGIVAQSYGTALAQQYASKYKGAVRKLIYSAPDAGRVVDLKVEPVLFVSLRRIYESPYFDFLDEIANKHKLSDLRGELVTEARRVSDTVEKSFWNAQYVIENYEQLRGGLRKNGLDFGREFFAALRSIRLSGWLSFDEDLYVGADANVDTVQHASGLIIARAILERKHIKLEQELNSQKKGILRSDIQDKVALLKWAESFFSKPSSQKTARAYYVISIYDGLNGSFLEEFSQTGNLRAAIQKFAALGPNDPLQNVGLVSGEKPHRWHAGRFKHSVPTLILKGGADPVTEGGQAEEYFYHGFYEKTERVLIEFPGIGHAMTLPELGVNAGSSSNIVISSTDSKNRKATRVKLDSREALIHHFLSNDFAGFKKASILEHTERAFKKLLHGRPAYGYSKNKRIVDPKFLPNDDEKLQKVVKPARYLEALVGELK